MIELNELSKPRTLDVDFKESEYLSDIEFANFCVVLCLTDGSRGTIIHFRVNHTREDIIESIQNAYAKLDVSNTRAFLYGGNDGYKPSKQLIDTVLETCEEENINIVFKDLLGEMNRKARLRSAGIELTRLNFRQGSYDNSINIFIEA